MVERYDEVQAWGSRGDGEGELDAPFGIAVDHAGLVYVADTSNHRIVKFTATGGYVDSWGHFSPPDHDGWDAGFDLPFGIAVDNRGSIYVSDSRNGRVQQWTSAGGFVSSWGRGETYSGSFSPPAGVAVNPAGDVLAFDGTSGHIRVFDGVAPHRCRAVWGGWSEGLADGRFRRRTGSFGVHVFARAPTRAEPTKGG